MDLGGITFRIVVGFWVGVTVRIGVRVQTRAPLQLSHALLLQLILAFSVKLQKFVTAASDEG